MRSVVSRMRCPALEVKFSCSATLPDSGWLGRAILMSDSSTTGLAARQYFSVVPLRVIGTMPLLQSITSKIANETCLTLADFALAASGDLQPDKSTKLANSGGIR